MIKEIYIRPVTLEDIQYNEVAFQMINAAYRSSESWTTDNHLVSIDRVQVEDIQNLIEKSGQPNVLLYAFDVNTVIGCILIQPEQNGEALLSLLAVSPTHQSRGIGKQLIEKAIGYVQTNMPNINQVLVHVFDCRKELVNWYIRLGFVDKRELIPFPYKEILLAKEAPLLILRMPVI
ncbi:hypothetical protein CU098_012647 [Rhizopus stolonifer]|uniref:N-acetyltransferase domain-containing protein n=1 Tax=Rhizopus stolonifer TaxID=4846 RepID=A0A367KUC2_RHIST|nr:hypothetical protein CU098_012647 [Rhizopus stolonifer]